MVNCFNQGTISSLYACKFPNVEGESDFPIKTDVVAYCYEKVIQSLLEDDSYPASVSLNIDGDAVSQERDHFPRKVEESDDFNDLEHSLDRPKSPTTVADTDVVGNERQITMQTWNEDDVDANGETSSDEMDELDEPIPPDRDKCADPAKLGESQPPDRNGVPGELGKRVPPDPNKYNGTDVSERMAVPEQKPRVLDQNGNDEVANDEMARRCGWGWIN